MYCKKCGNLIEEGSGFCGGCGAPLKPANNIVVIEKQSNGADDQTKSIFSAAVPGNAKQVEQPKAFEQPIYLNNEPQLILKAKKKSKLPLIITIVLVFVIGGAAAAVFGVSALNTKKYDELIDTGNKYLEELKYEEAVETYLDAIDIKPKREEAYVGAATGYVKLDEPEKAKDILELGLERIKEPSEKFTDLCDELGVDYEGSDSDFESESKVVQKQYTADDIEELSKYLYGKGYDQIEWNNMNRDAVETVFWGAVYFGGIPNFMDSNPADYTNLANMFYEKHYLNLHGIYKLSDLNKNVKILFGDKSHTLGKDDFPVYDGSDSFRIGQDDSFVYIIYYPDLDCILVLWESIGWEEWDLDYIVDSLEQDNTIVVKRRFFTIDTTDNNELETIPYKEPSGFDWGSATFSEKQEVAKNYYSAAKSVGIDVDEYITEYTLAFNADGTIYLKSVSDASVVNPENTPVQTTASIFGRSISTVYMVKTKAGGPVNLRSGPGLDFAPVTTLPNSTVVTGQALSKDEQWVYVSVNGTSGWVSLEFLMVYS